MQQACTQHQPPGPGRCRVCRHLPRCVSCGGPLQGVTRSAPCMICTHHPLCIHGMIVVVAWQSPDYGSASVECAAQGLTFPGLPYCSTVVSASAMVWAGAVRLDGWYRDAPAAVRLRLPRCMYMSTDAVPCSRHGKCHSGVETVCCLGQCPKGILPAWGIMHGTDRDCNGGCKRKVVAVAVRAVRAVRY